MKFRKWNQDKNYDNLDSSGRYSHANGVIPTGATVKHTADGDIGSVLNSNIERTLVSFRNQDVPEWYNNTDLMVGHG